MRGKSSETGEDGDRLGGLGAAFGRGGSTRASDRLRPGSPRTDGVGGLGGVGFEDLEVGGVAVDAVAAVAGDFFEDADFDQTGDQAVGGGKFRSGD